MASEHGLSISVADVTNELPATTGWDVWAAVTTDAFEVTEVTDVTVTVSGNLPAGYWGDFDNFILEQYV
jgi:arabinogalactan endo-1,4-beta-galactosidase